MIRRWIGLLWFTLMALSAGAAQPVSTHWLTGAAIGGKDAVAYHDASTRSTHQAQDGQAAFTVQYLGRPWRFASQASADKFAANPAAYVPQYNGFCSNALASDEGLYATSGEVWEFFGDKLHLFYAERGRQRWLTGDWRAYQQAADRAWQAILAQPDRQPSGAGLLPLARTTDLDLHCDSRALTSHVNACPAHTLQGPSAEPSHGLAGRHGGADAARLARGHITAVNVARAASRLARFTGAWRRGPPGPGARRSTPGGARG